MTWRLQAIALAALALHALGAAFAEPAKPPAPPLPQPLDVPDLVKTRPLVLCVDCDKPFDVTVHKGLLEGLAGNRYVAELRKALYVQDLWHQFESKAHFDNCDFDGATGYLASLLDEVRPACRNRASRQSKQGR